MRIDPGQLSALAAVVRCGAFDLAAAELNVTPSAVSQRIKALEEQMGATLVRRGTPCTATPMGQRLAKHAEDLGVLEAQVLRDLAISGQELPARLRIAVNADSLATWFVPALAEISDILFEVVIDDQDHSADWLRKGEVSAAVTGTGKPVRGFDMHRLGAFRYVATASPTYVRKWFPNGVTPEALAAAPCLIFNGKDRLQSRWIFAATGARMTPPSHWLPSTHAFIDAACAGLGWGMNPSALIQAPVAAGDLVILRPDIPLDVALDWQVSRAMASAITPLTRAVLRAAQVLR